MSDVFVGEECALNAIPWLEGSKHIGESAAVVGRVVSWSHEMPTEATSTLLYLGTLEPFVERLTIEIPPIAALRFGESPENALSGRMVCVFGSIRRGPIGPLIEIEQPEQITTVTESVLDSATDDDYASALDTVRSEGFEPFPSDQTFCFECTLHVIVGNCFRAASSDCQHAFFFVGQELVGRDPGPEKYFIRVIRQSSEEVTLGVTLFRAKDPSCCPSGGEVEVRFRWNGSALRTLDELPLDSRVFETNG